MSGNMKKQPELKRSITTVPCAHCTKTANFIEPKTNAAVCSEDCAKKARRQRRIALNAVENSEQDTAYTTKPQERPETFRNVSIN